MPHAQSTIDGPPQAVQRSQPQHSGLIDLTNCEWDVSRRVRVYSCLRRGQMCFNPLLVVQFSALQLWRLVDLSSLLLCLRVECEMPMLVEFTHSTDPSRVTLSLMVIGMRL